MIDLGPAIRLGRRAPALLALAAAACASPYERLAERGQSELVGLSRDRILACAGSPTETARRDGDELLVYYSELARRVAAAEGEARSPVPERDFAPTYTSVCETTFVLRAGRVVEVTMSGRTGAGRPSIAACGIVAERCLK
jgi:hypothetical protein